MLRQYADAIVRYRKGDVKYVKLLDGGLVDNYGLAGFTISRLLSNTPHGPLSAREGVKLRRVMFLVVDAGRQPSGAWSKTVAGPSGVDLIMATADTATGSSAAQSYTAFSEMMNDWQAKLVAWRCRLSADRAGAARRRAGLELPRREVLRQPRRLRAARRRSAPRSSTRSRRASSCRSQQVDMVIAAGRDALNANTKFRAFVRSLGRQRRAAASRRRQEGVPVAEETSDDFPQEATALAPR